MSQICPKWVPDISQICPKNAPALFKMCPRYVPEYCIVSPSLEKKDWNTWTSLIFQRCNRPTSRPNNHPNMHYNRPEFNLYIKYYIPLQCFQSTALSLNAEAFTNNRTFQAIKWEKLTRKFSKNNSCALLGADAYIWRKKFWNYRRDANIYIYIFVGNFLDLF